MNLLNLDEIGMYIDSGAVDLNLCDLRDPLNGIEMSGEKHVKTNNIPQILLSTLLSQTDKFIYPVALKVTPSLRNVDEKSKDIDRILKYKSGKNDVDTFVNMYITTTLYKTRKCMNFVPSLARGICTFEEFTVKMEESVVNSILNGFAKNIHYYLPTLSEESILTAIKGNLNIEILVIENIGNMKNFGFVEPQVHTNLFTVIKQGTNLRDLYKILFQVFYTIRNMISVDVVHNDLHFGNIGVVLLPVDKPLKLQYVVNNESYTFQTHFYVKIYDWDFAEGECFTNPENRIYANTRIVSKTADIYTVWLGLCTLLKKFYKSVPRFEAVKELLSGYIKSKGSFSELKAIGTDIDVNYYIFNLKRLFSVLLGGDFFEIDKDLLIEVYFGNVDGKEVGLPVFGNITNEGDAYLQMHPEKLFKPNVYCLNRADLIELTSRGTLCELTHVKYGYFYYPPMSPSGKRCLVAYNNFEFREFIVGNRLPSINSIINYFGKHIEETKEEGDYVYIALPEMSVNEVRNRCERVRTIRETTMVRDNTKRVRTESIPAVTLDRTVRITESTNK